MYLKWTEIQKEEDVRSFPFTGGVDAWEGEAVHKTMALQDEHLILKLSH